MSQMLKKRILVVDDNVEIHNDFNKILSKKETEVDEDEAVLFGIKKPQNVYEAPEYLIDSAYQGKEALELVKKALLSREPYSLAFIDMRMPPGWDGIETIKQIWAVDPYIQMVICSAYSDHSWEDIMRELGNSDNLLILKKPFEVIEINQMASALTRKWELIANLHRLVKNRTAIFENLYSLTQTTLESVEEGIIAVGLEGNILIYNKKFLEQWSVPEDLLKTEKSTVVFSKIAESLESPALFLDMITELNAHPKIKEDIEWRLNNGVLLELYAHPQYLHNEIIGIVYSFSDITERKELEKQLLHQATHDILTGLPNRALLMDRLKQAIEHAKHFNLQVGVLLLDLDLFKLVNDSLGHDAGDTLLKCVSKKIRAFIRNNDTVARLGGDEFVVLVVAQSKKENFLGLLTRFINLFSKPYDINQHEVISTVSIGVSIYPQDGQDSDTLLKNADAALYQAKELGGNRFQFYLEEFNRHLLARAEIKTALNQALLKNEFFLNYQPLIDLQSNQIIGVEALLRWQHPTMGLVPPTTFIPIAEETGFIISIGEWVLRTACIQTQIWHQTPSLSKIKISVNISVIQFRQSNFVSIVRDVLEKTQLNPSCLELEVTESLILGNISELIEKMIELKSLGVKFAIDDFGTGYSTLSYLKHFPFDTVKIDKSFIDNITSDPNNASIVEAIIAMTKNMKINVLAEGVEHKEQVDFLRSHHANQIQGYYFKEPLSEFACTSLLLSPNTLKTG